MQYFTSIQMAEKRGLTKRRVNSLCQNGNIKVGSGKKPLPIGITDYRMAVSRYYYVDKTLFIKDLLDYHPLVSLFTRPRRFGKT